jgi:copper chaperone CopZ
MAQIKLYADNMTCASCVNSIKAALGVMEGVENVEIDLDAGHIRVERSFSKFQDLIASLGEAGFPAVIDLGGISPFTKSSGGNSCCCG